VVFRKEALYQVCVPLRTITS